MKDSSQYKNVNYALLNIEGVVSLNDYTNNEFDPSTWTQYIASLDTSVSGVISTDTTWSVANSPYIVTSDVLVQIGVTLTIEPGVIVKFDSGISIIVDGTLVSQGESIAPIQFTSNSITPNIGDWGGIQTRTGGLSARSNSYSY